MRIFDPKTGKPVVAFDVDENLIGGKAALEWIVRTDQAEEVLIVRDLPKGSTHEDILQFLREGPRDEAGEVDHV